MSVHLQEPGISCRRAMIRFAFKLNSQSVGDVSPTPSPLATPCGAAAAAFGQSPTAPSTRPHALARVAELGVYWGIISPLFLCLKNPS